MLKVYIFLKKRLVFVLKKLQLSLNWLVIRISRRFETIDNAIIILPRTHKLKRKKINQFNSKHVSCLSNHSLTINFGYWWPPSQAHCNVQVILAILQLLQCLKGLMLNPISKSRIWIQKKKKSTLFKKRID